LIAPLFALLLLLFSFWARWTLCQLALIQLSRDSALLMARNGSLWRASLRDQQEALRGLAQRDGRLEPERLSLRREPLLFNRLGAAASNGAGDWVSQFTGRRYTLRYEPPLRGLAARLLPAHLGMEESLAVQGDPWKLQLSDFLSSFLR